MVLAIAACSFRTTTAETGDDHGGGTSDAPPTPDLDAAIVDGSPPRVACSAADPTGLVACYEFQDDFTDGTLLDSTTNHHDAATVGMTRVMRGASDAAGVGSSARTYVPPASDLDRSDAYTLAMWIHPHTLPSGGGVDGLVDHEQQYAMAIVDSFDDGLLELRCIHTNIDHEYVGMTTSTSWSLVACTYANGTMCAHRFTSASNHDSFCHSNAGTPATTGSHGLAIGHLSDQGAPLDRFDGDIDSVQLYARALPRAELCAIAAQPATCLDP